MYSWSVSVFQPGEGVPGEDGTLPPSQEDQLALSGRYGAPGGEWDGQGYSSSTSTTTTVHKTITRQGETVHTEVG